MEMDTPAGAVDAVFVTPTGRLALLEAKLWRNPEARREVIGQILDYAKELPAWDYSRLDVAVRQARKQYMGDNFAGIAEYVAQRYPDLIQHHFQDAVTRSLGRGDYLLLIAGDGIREGVGAIAQFLDRNESLHFTFGLIECAVYETPGGGHYVHPRILASTTKIMRTVVAAKLSEVPEEDSSIEENNGISSELIQNREKYRAFWSEFLRMIRTEAAQVIPKPGISTNQFFYLPKESTGWVAVVLVQSKGECAVYLSFSWGPKGDQIFEILKSNQTEIDRALGCSPRWYTKNGQHTILVSKHFPGVLLTDSREVVQRWLAEHTERFLSVFRPRIDQILREQS